MSKALISTTLTTATAVTASHPLSTLGTVLRRFGCAIGYSNGSTIYAKEQGYYTLDANVEFTPTASGTIAISVYVNGNAIPGATTAVIGTAGESSALTLSGIPVRVVCCNPQAITLVFSAAGSVTNSLITVRKE